MKEDRNQYLEYQNIMRTLESTSKLSTAWHYVQTEVSVLL